MIPQLDLAGARRAHTSLCERITGLTDDQVRRASLLPGWTVGHVLTHLARNADSITGVFEAANAGEIGDQYPGGAKQRNADIDAGAVRTAADLVADVRDSCARLDRAWAETSDAAWALGSGRMMAGELPLSDIVFRRWREVEVHHADLGLAFTWRDWSDEYVDLELELSARYLAARLTDDDVALRIEPSDAIGVWIVEPVPVERTLVRGTRHELLAWILGRDERPDWPELTPW
jgi:maleylpyruvate isomerase